MRKTAMILAAATAFDLGVMAVSAQAQQRVQPPPRASGAAVQDPTGPGGNGGCTPGLPNSGASTGPCTDAPVAISDQGAVGGLEPWRSTAQPDIKLREEYFFLKIDPALSLRACVARRGEVVRREGSQQCRLPAAGAPAIGNPTRNLPGGIPPRH